MERRGAQSVRRAVGAARSRRGAQSARRAVGAGLRPSGSMRVRSARPTAAAADSF
jgi:hypothetical protein